MSAVEDRVKILSEVRNVRRRKPELRSTLLSRKASKL